MIGTYAKLVDDRNSTAHPNGNIFFSTQSALDGKIREILRIVREIQKQSRPVIETCYRQFLVQNHNADEREYADPTDQVCEVLIHGNYLSQRDIDICLALDPRSIVGESEMVGALELHRALAEEYGDRERENTA